MFHVGFVLSRTKQVPGKLAEKHPSDENRDTFEAIECFVFLAAKINLPF